MPSLTKGIIPYDPNNSMIKLSALSLLASLCALSLAQADTLLSTYDWPGEYYYSLNDTDDDFTSEYIAVAFTTGDQVGGYEFSSLTLGFDDAVGSPSGSIFISLYSYVANDVPNAGSLLASLAGNMQPTTAGNQSYTSSGSLFLSASTSYWFLIGVTGLGSGESYTVKSTYYTDSETPTPNPSGWTVDAIDFYQYVDGSGVVWSGATPVTPETGASLAFSIDATPVPEPSTLGLMAGGGVLLLARRRFSLGRRLQA